MNDAKFIDHFPLQSDLKKLKFNFQKLISTLIFPAAFLFQPAQKYFDKIIRNDELLLLVGFAALILITILVEYLTRGYYYNSFGIGIIRSFGNKSNWYSFDELIELKVNQKGLRHSKNASTSIKMAFYSGKVKVDTNSFVKAGVEDLADIVQKKKPDSSNQQPDKKSIAEQIRSSIRDQIVPGLSDTSKNQEK